MLCRVKMFGRMFVLRTVTAAYVTAVQAHTQVNPGVADLQALFAPLGIGTDITDRIEMRT